MSKQLKQQRNAPPQSSEIIVLTPADAPTPYERGHKRTSVKSRLGRSFTVMSGMLGGLGCLAIGAALAGVAIALFLGVCYLVGLALAPAVDTNQSLREHGIIATAITVDAYQSHDEDCTDYIVSFQDQAEQTVRVDVGCDDSLVHIGEKTKVIYPVREPSKAMLLSQAGPPNPLEVGIGTLIAMLFVLAFLSNLISKPSTSAEE